MSEEETPNENIDASEGGEGNENSDEGAGGGEEHAQDNAPEFREMLPEEYREDPALQDIKDIEGLTKGYLHGQKMIGKLGGADPDRLIVKPGKDATPEEMEAYYNQIGRPESAEEYELPEPSEDANWTPDEKLTGGFREAAHKAGLTPEQTKALYEWYGETAEEMVSGLTGNAQKEYEESEKAMKEHFGEKEYEARMKRAVSVAKKLGGEDIGEWIDRSGAGNQLAFVKMLDKVADMMSEDDLGGEGGNSQFGMTPAQAKAELHELGLDKEFQNALFDRDHPEHKNAVDRRSKLFKAAYPGTERTEPIVISG